MNSNIENYEEKYKEALERAQSLSIDGFLDAVAVSDIFPELKENENEYIIITWPDIQRLMKEEDFSENCHVIVEDPFLDKYGFSYFVNKKWFENHSKSIKFLVH